jgi:hypothetical protein
MRRHQTKSMGIFLFFFLSILFLGNDLFSQDIKVRVIKQNAVLRVQRDDASIAITTLPLGATYQVEEISGEWIKIILPPNDMGVVIKGYIFSSFVEIEYKTTQQEPKKDNAPVISKIEPKANSQDENLLAWDRKMKIAQSKKSTGDTLNWIGVGIATVGSFLYAFDKKEDVSYSYGYYTTTTTTTRTGKSEYLIASIGGALVGLIGFAINSPANDEIKILELEGAKKGYIKAGLGPIKKGFAFQLEYVF